MNNQSHRQLSPFQQKWHNIIFEADTPAGKAFDIILLIAIIISVLVVMLESVASLQAKLEAWFTLLEWIFTILFTIEYLFRIWCSYRPKAYIWSFYGLIDLLCILPTYAEVFFGGAHFLLTIRILRLMRIFRIFKLVPFLNESRQLSLALQQSKRKIMVFLFFIGLLTMVLGAIMYVIECNHNSGFTSIPVSVYWAVVTLTTVGYGDIAPVTPIGQAFSAVIMIMGYAIIAVPTGIVTVEMSRIRHRDEVDQRVCPHCMREGHETDAVYCKFCGSKL
ncbi:ion transporter [Chitinophaga nivalis]|uniref:Ion transporter n=1 Tax=Chitinophaga nivalis TaxID=2991709 RepID=A0ABT3IL06_9BACT|nr:ion transporter [Chitinophaga nivalis]MCW3465654.1 ion transporter [Chitinophaga nivalis]MCW3484655.1 ion transporter [Chitinophaga nivalis]